ncbi:hypothetical protein FRC01_000547, partial [Tulasnella sp. 417]
MLRSLVIVSRQEVDRDSKEVVFEDVESGYTLFIKTVDVRKAADDTSLLVVQFQLDAKSPGREYAFWNFSCSTPIGQHPAGTQSAGPKTAFILTIGPIEKSQLSRDLSCAVCMKQSKPAALGVNQRPTVVENAVDETQEDLQRFDEHGDNPFLIQVQYNGTPFILAYDRTRALDTHLNRNDNPRVFDQIAALAREKGFGGMKIW